MNEPTHQLDRLERLMLNAGQLEFPSKQARAVALALAMSVNGVSCDCARGKGHMPPLTTVMELASEIITVKPPLDVGTTLHAYESLIAGRYFRPNHDRSAYLIDTTTLPMRMTEEDAADVSHLPSQLESDLFGYGDG